MIKTWCVGGKQYSNTNNVIQYEKINPRTEKLVKIIKKIVVFVDETNLNFLLSKLLQEKILIKNENAKIDTVHPIQVQHGVN